MTEPADLRLAAVQTRLREILRGLHHSPLAAVAALSEEVGELSKLLLDHHGYGKPLVPEALGGELADCLVCLSEIATLHGIDLAAAVGSKVEDIARRAPKWRAELGPAIERSWREPHGPGARCPDA